jgi:dolichyl-phosphate-mannose-protein mannosyltransferase
MMASEKGVLASGLESDSQSTRRRNVPSTSPNGGMVNRVEIDDKKIQMKKVRAGKFLWKLGLLFHQLVLTLSLFTRKSKHYWNS